MSKRKRVTRPKEELKRELIEQLQTLRRSCDSYDQGFEPAAKQIAVILRILVHEHGQSKALLEQLGVRQCRFWDSTGPIDPHNLISDHKLVGIKSASGKWWYVPLGEHPEGMRRVRFQDWWNETIFKDGKGQRFSRGDVIKHVADTDGGAHVDPDLDERYMDLSRGNSLGWTTGRGAPPQGRPELAAIRQMGSELLWTIRDSHPEYLRPIELASPSPVRGNPTSPEIEEA